MVHWRATELSQEEAFRWNGSGTFFQGNEMSFDRLQKEMEFEDSCDRVRRLSEQEIMELFKHYDFRDQLGHPLEEAALWLNARAKQHYRDWVYLSRRGSDKSRLI
jgi:hypothetical protein